MLLALLILTLANQSEGLAARYFGDLPIASFNTYVVEGENVREVAASLERQRPVLADGTQGYAVTSWRMPTQWGSDGLGECAPQTVRITVEFDVTFPVLARSAELALKDEERAKWHDYMDFLATHEARRMRRVVLGVRELERRMRAAPDCGSLNPMLADGVREIGASARSLDMEVAEEFRKNPSTRRGFP
jgi:predicted secreted Zn-dependent protease